MVFLKALNSVVADIIVELTRLQSVPFVRRNDGDDFPLPRMIGAGNGGSLFISKKIDVAITEVARRLIDNEPSRKASHTQAEWRAAVRRSFGPALASIDLDDNPEDNAERVLQLVRAALCENQPRQEAREHAFGCTLFGTAKFDPFAIGPVRFETRHDWLSRQVAAGYISTVTARRIGEAWKGKHLGKRKVSNGSLREDDILAAIGSCPFVCSVTTAGLADEAASTKALTAARLALAAIALLWQTPSRALSGFNLLADRSVRRVKTLVFAPPTHVLSGSSLSHMPHGPWLRPGEWEKLLQKWSDHFAVAAHILDYLLSPTGNVPRPKIMNALAQALMWFHEACRETVTLMSIVKYTASMDALAGGHGAPAITRLIAARAGRSPQDPIRVDGASLTETIKKIYGDGRSRTVHGTNDRLGWDWSDTNGLAEYFARFSLVACIDWAATNTLRDDPALFQK